MVVTIDELERGGAGRAACRRRGDRRARHDRGHQAGERKIVARGRGIVDAIHANVLAELPAGQREAFVGALRQLVGGRLVDAGRVRAPGRRGGRAAA